VKLPLSLEQESFFGRDPVLAPNIALTYRLTGTVSVDALRSAASLLLARHDGLRFRLEEAVPAVPATGQRIAEPDGVLIEPEYVSEDELWHRADDGHRAPLDLAAEGPVRFRLYRTGAQDHLLAITIHPAALDAWGIGILDSEFWRLYRGVTAGTGERLADPPLRFSDHVLAQRAAGPDLAEPRRAGYLRALRELDAGALRWRSPDAPPVMHACETFKLDASVLGGISRVARALKVTPAATFLAGFELALGTASRTTAGALSCIYAGRDKTGAQAVAAAMARRLPVRFEFTATTRVGDFVQQAMLGWAAAVGASYPPYSSARLVRLAGGPLDVLEPVFNLRVSAQGSGHREAHDDPPHAQPSPLVTQPQGPRPHPIPMWPQFGRTALFALVTLASPRSAVTAVHDPRAVPEDTVRSLFRIYARIIRVISEGGTELTVGHLAESVTA
jgi:hypothetical protein